jgi:hypothetical protein
MILFTCREWTETEHAWPGAPLRSFRWALVVEWGGIEWQLQIKYPDGDWSCSRAYSVGFRSKWRFRLLPEHFYYDGPNCCINWGFVGAWWQPLQCEKCWPDDAEEPSKS